MQRQIPQETLFKTNSLSSWKDPSKRNRYHFKFPNNWITTAQKESIVGIRSLYIMPNNKQIQFTIQAVVQYKDSVGASGWYDLSDEIVYLSINEYFNENTRLDDIINKIDNIIKNEINISPYNVKLARVLKCYYQYSMTNDFEYEYQFVIESPYNKLPESDRVKVIATGEGEYYWQYNRIKFEIKDINDDARTMLHFVVDGDGKVIDTRGDDESDPVGTYKTDPFVTHGLYDYNQCIAYSDLACMTEDNFLGRTRNSDIIPIKYYELKNNNQSFWVDLYAATNHKAAVELNEGDDLYIEAQLLMSSKAVL